MNRQARIPGQDWYSYGAVTIEQAAIMHARFHDREGDVEVRDAESGQVWKRNVQRSIDFRVKNLRGDADAKPDPGEGWELCDFEQSESCQWKHQTDVWYDFSLSDKRSICCKEYVGRALDKSQMWSRRRTLVTEPPSVEAVGDDADVFSFHAKHGWRILNGKICRREFDPSTSLYERYGGLEIAWCHRLPGETEPPEHIREAAEALIAERNNGEPDASTGNGEGVNTPSGDSTPQVSNVDVPTSGSPSGPEQAESDETRERREWSLQLLEKESAMQSWQNATVFELPPAGGEIHVREVLPGDDDEIESLKRERDELQAAIQEIAEFLGCEPQRDSILPTLISWEPSAEADEREAAVAEVLNRLDSYITHGGVWNKGDLKAAFIKYKEVEASR